MRNIIATSASFLDWDLVNDLSAFPENENAITEILLHRMENERIYTWVGPLLLALNPDKQVNNLYEESQRMKFTGDVDPAKNPHIYAVANRARYRFLNDLGKKRQVIVISGESGTGKTFNARKALDFLASTKIPKTSTFGPLEKGKSCDEIVRKIGNIFPLISAFSTARTLKNSKSSRHGKLLRLEYDKINGVVRGCSVHSFLLERTRVTACSDNFEIFYQLVYGLSDREIDELLLSRSKRYIIMGNCESRDKRLFIDEFRETVDSLEALGFKDELRNDIFRIIAFLLHLGNIRFRKKSGEGCMIDLVDEESRDALKNVCSVISLPEYELIELLTSTLICPKSSQKRHTSYRRELKTPEDCRNRLFSIARYIYGRLFNWLVDRVNETLTTNEKNDDWLGILDIFGFESFEFNGIEQLCINYATERLQLHFMEDYLEAGEIELREEGLETLSSSSTIQLYRDRLDIIETRVFATFNDACQSPIPPDFSHLFGQLFFRQNEDRRFLQIRLDDFIIKHYSCPVTYDAKNLLSKNTDKVPTELSSTFGKCKNELLRFLTLIEEENSPGNRSSMKKSTALGKLELSLDSLCKELRMCDSHYVRCARPRRSNNSWAKNEFREQLYGTGIFDALPLTKCKLPVKFQYEDFYKRYLIERSKPHSNLLHCLSDILNTKNLSTSVHLGKRSIFLTEAIFFDLENYRKNQRSRCAEKIQKFWMKTRQKRRAKDSARILAEKMTEETSKAKKLNLSQQNEKNNNQNELEEVDNVSSLMSLEIKNLRSIVTIKNEISLDKSQKSNFSNRHLPEEFPLNQRFLGKNELTLPSRGDRLKRLNVLYWLSANSLNFPKFGKSNSTRKWKYSNEAEQSKGSTKMKNKCPLFYRNGILSRRRPIEIPIKFHTRLTCLPYSHCQPSSMRPRGLEDCLLDTVKMIVDY